jgi:predicted component of type VI protein secretion system
MVSSLRVPLASIWRAFALVVLVAGCSESTPMAADMSPSPDVSLEDQTSDQTPDAAAKPAAIYLQVESSMPTWVATRFTELLSGSSTLSVKRVADNEPIVAPPAGSLVFAIGKTKLSERFVPQRRPDLRGAG